MNKLSKSVCSLALAVMAFTAAAQSAQDFIPYQRMDLRLPSVPLITNDPFFSIWSNYDNLYDGPTCMWCEHEKAIDGILRVDGTAYRFMGVHRENLLKPIAPMTVDGNGWEGKVTHRTPASTWYTRGFNDSSWATEQAAWGTRGEYPNVNNDWTAENSDIWVRRYFTVADGDWNKDLWVRFSHDDVFELYINGIQVVSTGETWRQGEEVQLSKEVKMSLSTVAKNVIAVHCHNTRGGAYVDFGIYENIMPTETDVQIAQQNSVDVMATSTYYNFTCGPVDLDVKFTSPQLIDDLDLISTPINYISYQVKSNDGEQHDVQFYLATSAQLCVNEMNQPTVSSFQNIEGIECVRAGSEEQPILGRSGDVISIDWGWLYIPAINGRVAVADNLQSEISFAADGKLPTALPGVTRSRNRSEMPSLVFVSNLGKVSEARNFMLIGYDEVYDIQYMHKNYKAYYARNGKNIFDQFKYFRDNYASIMKRCYELDKVIYNDGLAAGNKKYAEQLAANYRLVMAAHKLFEDEHGHLLYFSKENKSNGCVNTVDLTYPECPLYLTYNPVLQRAMVESILEYALTDARKNLNCAAHDLGQYPLANGQVYGDTMPLEESANILILCDAICRITGDGSWLSPYRTPLMKWGEYCYKNGQNPGNQLCTDDFKGPSEQNTNLSVKAILGVAAYANIAKYINPRHEAIYNKYARQMALLWEADARDGDHYKMEFHKPGTWSQKYNLFWDKMWGTEIFPQEVFDREISFYLRKQSNYGLPLDSRDMQTKSDWILWTAALSPDTETFLKFSDLHWKYINETRTRIPLSDYFWSDSGYSCNFSARSVLGGLWSKVMLDKYQIVPQHAVWEPKGNHIKTRWAELVDPENTLAEYPRPQLQREEWMNLNGLWDYAIAGSSVTDSDFTGEKILVPFPIESSLSGVMKPLEPNKTLWYRREIQIPDEWKGKKIILNFGAVDYQTTVYMNGIGGRFQVGSHTGGHAAFSFDITSRLTDGRGTLYVRVTDPTEPNDQPVGKQRRYPNGGGDIFYTSTSGIWQTVWLEPVEKTYVSSIHTTPDYDKATFNFDIKLKGTATGSLTVKVLDGERVVGSQTVAAASTNSLAIEVPGFKTWGPSSPFLYGVEVTLTDGDQILDKAESYAAMRKISYAKDANGYWKFQLNNHDYFQFGPLDQGYWPDGLLTAPTDEALAFDVEKTKEWGFNMIRKHMKTEPERWYYHCDRLGILVWQDMPSQFRCNNGGWVTEDWCTNLGTQDATVEKRYRDEWAEIINQLYSYPCIVAWTPFNENWGQFKTPEIVAYTRSLDPTRLINPASGGNHYMLESDNAVNTFVDQHTYAQPIYVYERVVDPNRPYVLGEYGGLGRNITDHRWYERNAQTYNTYTNEKSITDDYVKLSQQIADIARGYKRDGKKINYCAAVYTQTTDVETEVNGLMTYDREIIKLDETRLTEANLALSQVFGTDYNGVDDIVADAVAGQDTYYNLMGIRLDAPTTGINIVRHADGSVTKILAR